MRRSAVTQGQSLTASKMRRSTQRWSSTALSRRTGDLRAALAVYTQQYLRAAAKVYDDTKIPITAVSQDGRKYRREATKHLRAVVSEVYSAPRVTEAAQRHPRPGLSPGLALDLTVRDDDGRPWDFNDPEQRRQAEKLIDEKNPLIFISSPMCTVFWHIQNSNKANRDPKVVEHEVVRARVHIAFWFKLYKKQIDRGASLLHEHPRLATP